MAEEKTLQERFVEMWCLGAKWSQFLSVMMLLRVINVSGELNKVLDDIESYKGSYSARPYIKNMRLLLSIIKCLIISSKSTCFLEYSLVYLCMKVDSYIFRNLLKRNYL